MIMDLKAINPLAWTGLRKFILILAAVFVALAGLRGRGSRWDFGGLGIEPYEAAL